MTARTTARTTLDWRDRRHWGGAPRPCRVCGFTTLLVDDAAGPCHKVCAEAELDAALARAAKR